MHLQLRQCDDSLHASIIASLPSFPSPSHEALPSLPSSSSLELKSLPNSLKYAFLDLNETFSRNNCQRFESELRDPSLRLVKQN